MPPSGWPAKSYLTQAREAVRDWLTIEIAGDEGDLIINVGDATLITISGLSIDSTTAPGRKLRITDCNIEGNEGIYTVISGSGNELVISPAIPTPAGITSLEFSLETAVAAYFKSLIWYEEQGRLPANVLNECPLLVMTADGQYQNDARFSQVNVFEVPFHFQIAGSGRNQENCEYAFCLVRDRLFRGRDGQNNFRMPSDLGYRYAVIGAPTFTLQDNSDGNSTAAGLFWLCEFVLSISIARTVNTSA